jgi:hypothetical protein
MMATLQDIYKKQGLPFYAKRAAWRGSTEASLFIAEPRNGTFYDTEGFDFHESDFRDWSYVGKLQEFEGRAELETRGLVVITDARYGDSCVWDGKKVRVTIEEILE